MKKVLIVHNKYLEKGGEDSVVKNELNLLKSNGVNVSLLEYDNKKISVLMLFRNSKSRIQLEQKINELNPDIIHFHNVFYTATPDIINTAKRHNIQVVMTLHNFRLICPSAILFFNGKVYEKNIHSVFPFDGVMRGVFQDSSLKTFLLSSVIFLHRWLGTWKKVDKYIFLTEFAKKRVLNSSIKLPTSKFYVKSNFAKKPSVQIDGIDREQYIFVGRLSEEKGLNILIKAIKKSDKKLIIYGDGTLKESIEEVAKNSWNINYKGFQPYEILIKDIAESAALIFPSIWYEGMPMTIIESFSVGTPVIASKLGSMEEMIQSNINGLLFEPNNPDELLRCINQMSNADSYTYSSLRKSTEECYSVLYSEKVAFANLVKIYED